MDLNLIEALQKQAISTALVNGQKVEHDLKALIKKNRFDINRIPEPNSGILFFNGELVGSKGNLMTLTGQAKSRKTVMANSIASAAISGQSVLGVECRLEPDDVILHIDTEQGYDDYYNGVLRILQNAGVDYVPDNFVSIHERAFDTAQRLQSLDIIFAEYKPRLVIIDGIRDMLMDFNSNEETAKVISTILRLSDEHKALIVCVIHVTKSNGNMRGALGTALEDKSETAIKVEKDQDNPNRSTVKPIYSRHKDFETYSIVWSDDAMGYILEEAPAMKQAGRPKKAPMSIDQLKEALPRAMKYGAMIDRVKGVVGCGDNSAKAMVKGCIQEGMIIKDLETGLYTTPFLSV